MKTRDPIAMRYEYVVVEGCTCIRGRGKAILIKRGDCTVWIPQSKIHDDSECYEKGTAGTVILPRWLAEDKGLAYREVTR